MERVIFIGDVHGCLAELVELLDRLNPAPEDSLIFLGDLIDRGPDPVGVVRFVRNLRQTLNMNTPGTTLLGNHEEKALRWHRHENRRAADPKYKNPMKRVPEARLAEWRGLNADDLEFLGSCPPYLDPLPDWYAVHGGFVPGKQPGLQKVGEMIRCRWVDTEGHHVGMMEGSLDMPPGARPWMEAFDGPFNVVCGHAVHSLVDPRIDQTTSGFEVWSIDTGCVFGGRLTALVLDPTHPDRREVVQVQARQKYAELRGGGVE
jgi:hypothetical protein